MMGQVIWYRDSSSTKNEDAVSSHEAQTYRAFNALEGQLGKSGGGSVLPGGFSAVDAHFYPWLNRYSDAQLKLDSYPKIQRWMEVIGKMPAVTEAYERLDKA